MSFDATRSVWTARASGAIQGGPELYVALAMADRAHSRTGELSAGTRGLAELLGLGRSTVGRALRDLEADGVVEAMARGTGAGDSVAVHSAYFQRDANRFGTLWG